MCVYAPCTINTCTCNQTAKHNQYEVCNHVCLHMYVLQCVLNCLTHKFAKIVWPKQAHDLHALSMQKCSKELPLTINPSHWNLMFVKLLVGDLVPSCCWCCCTVAAAAAAAAAVCCCSCWGCCTCTDASIGPTTAPVVLSPTGWSTPTAIDGVAAAAYWCNC